MDYINPEISENINKIMFRWVDWDLTVSAERLGKDGKAELWFFVENKNGKKPFEVVDINLLAPNSMKSLARGLANNNSKDIPWEQVLTKIKIATLDFQRRGEPGFLIKPTTEDIQHPGYYIEPIIMKNVPNVLYGDKGVNKTTLCLSLLGIVCAGTSDSISGFKCFDDGIRCGMLDWESSRDMTYYNTSRLFESGTIPYFELPYLKCRRPLIDDIDRIITWKESNSLDLILIDSLGQAAGADRFDSSGKTTALLFFEALNSLNVTSLIIAQNSKSQDGKKSIFGSVYYQYYSRNIFELRDTEISTDHNEKIVALIHDISNYSKKYEPIGLRVSYSDTAISIESYNVTLSNLKAKLGDSEMILDFMKNESRLVSVKEIAEAIQKKDSQIRVVLSGLKKRGLVVNPTPGSWGLAYSGH
jgi:hypothetical protein